MTKYKKVLVVPTNKASEPIGQLKDFRNNSASFRGVFTKLQGGEYLYSVFSYEELIATVRIVWDHSTGYIDVVEPWITPEKFSVTTSKHTGQARLGIHKLVADFKAIQAARIYS